MAEDAEHAGEEGLPPPVALAELHAQETGPAPAPSVRPNRQGVHSVAVRIRQHDVANELIEVGARGEELPQRAPGRREVVELVEASARSRRRRAGSPANRRWRSSTIGGIDRRVDPRRPPRCRWRRSASATPTGGEMTTSPPMSSLQCMWLRNAADSSRSAIAALAEQAVGLLEHRDAGPLEVTGIGDDAVALHHHLQPVVEPADHDRAHRAHASRCRGRPPRAARARARPPRPRRRTAAA